MSKGHDYNNSFYRTDRDTNRKKRNLIICVLSVLSVTLIAGGVLGWYFTRPSKELNVPKKPDPPVCKDIPDEKKVDCHPDLPVNEKACLNRGCCFSVPKNVSFNSSLLASNVPECYYPSNYIGYTITKVNETSRRINVKLQRTNPSGFMKDVKSLDIRILFIDDNSLRIKITDEDSERYEVPIPLYYQTKKLVKSLYSVNVDKKSGLLTVSRNSTGSIIFQTNLFRLVYSDQFLQLSSDLPSSYIYGIGEHYEKVLRSVNWTRFTLLNSDLSPIPNHALYGSQPFYMSLENDGKANGVFLLNSNVMDIILQPAPSITFRPIGGIFDFFIMLGPSPNDVTRQYSNIVGKPFIPPYWSLGFHLCKYGYNSLNNTRDAMKRTINAGIPLDVQWNDIDYMENYKDFTYDKNNFDGLPEFVDELHAKGMHYVLMIDPGISNSAQSYDPYDEGLDDDVFIKNADGSLFVGKVWPGTTVYPDFSHPAAVSFWTRQFQRLYEDIKYDGVWIDMNEPSNFFNGAEGGCPASSLENPQYLPGGNSLTTKTLCMTAKHYHTTHYNEHNLYGYREAVATNKAIRSVLKKRPFIISRASFAGQGVYSGHWSGDVFSTWEDMRYSIRSLINFNMYAVPMIGSDICGFNGNTTQELCARWQALGAFYPFSRNHNEIDTIDQDPASLGPIVAQASRITLQKRYTLLPYLYTLFYRSHVFGDTVIRPLAFEFPEDKNTYDIDEQFLWGSDLMVIQVLYPDTSTVNAYFPAGLWYDAIDGSQRNSTGEKVELTVPNIDIHLSVRGGAILAAQVPGLTTTETRKNPFTIAAALDQDMKAYGELYWDDGDSLETYENGFYNLIQFKASKGSLNSTVVKSGYATNMILQAISIIGYGEFPTNVSLNGNDCEYTTISLLNNATVHSGSSNETSDGVNPGIFGIQLLKPVPENGPECQFLRLGEILSIQTRPLSLLSPVFARWN